MQGSFVVSVFELSSEILCSFNQQPVYLLQKESQRTSIKTVQGWSTSTWSMLQIRPLSSSSSSRCPQQQTVFRMA